MRSLAGRHAVRVATVAALAVLVGCGGASAGMGSYGSGNTSAGVTSEAQSSQMVATAAPLSPPDDVDLAMSTLILVDDLPAGWTAVGGPPVTHSGSAPGGGCVPASLLVNSTASAAEDFSYPLSPQGLEKGHLTDVTLAFTTPTDLAALMQTVTSTQYRACISEEVQSEAAATGVTITGAATAAVVPLPAPLHGLHLHISFPYTFSGQTKVAQDEVICLTSGRLRARLELDTCCTPFSATMVDQLMSRAAAKLQASGSR